VSIEHLARHGLSSPEDIAVDGLNVYWTDIGTGTVASVPVGGGTATPLAEGQSSPRRLALDDDYVYWTNELGAAVMRAPKDGSGTPELVSAASSPWGIVVIGDRVCWINTGDNTLRGSLKTGDATVARPCCQRRWAGVVDRRRLRLPPPRRDHNETELLRVDPATGTVLASWGISYSHPFVATPSSCSSIRAGHRYRVVDRPFGHDVLDRVPANSTTGPFIQRCCADACGVYYPMGRGIE